MFKESNMTMKNKYCLLFLVTILVLLLGVGMVSATDTGNSSQAIKDINKLSTPANYDVDKMVQSDTTTVSSISDANVEKISTKEKTADNSLNKSSKNSATFTDTLYTTGQVSISGLNKISNDNKKESGSENFNSLSEDMTPIFTNEEQDITNNIGEESTITKKLKELNVKTDDVDKTNWTVNITWNDNANLAQDRPDSVKIDLYAKYGSNNRVYATVTLNNIDYGTNNYWNYTFYDLPKEIDENTVTYSCRLNESIQYYTNLSSTVNSNTTKITAKYNYTVCIVNVTWTDSNDNDRKRPDNIQVELYKNNVASGEKVTITNEMLVSSNKWQYIFKRLPAKNESNKVINYSAYLVEEIPDYTNTTIVSTTTAEPRKHTSSLTLTHQKEQVNITVIKNWDDNNNQDGKRPQSSIRVYVVQNDTSSSSLYLYKSKEWTGSLVKDRYTNGVENNFTINEPKVNYYDFISCTNTTSEYTLNNRNYVNLLSQ